MANEHNNNLKATHHTFRNEPPFNSTHNSTHNSTNEGDNESSSNFLEINAHGVVDTATGEKNKSQERTNRKSRTVSFSGDTGGFEHSKMIKRDSAAISNDENKSTTNVEYDDSNVPYDRGWAWVIDFSCYLLFFVYLSHDHWHSVLLLDYMQEFGIPITVLTIMMSVGSICYCVATQISSNVLVIRFSIRVVTTCAAILNVAATLLFAAVPNIAVFFIVNFIKYIVKGVTLIATLTLVGYYFRRRRGLATTLGLLGVGTSAMCAPPLIRYLRDEYGFQGCFLLMAGLEMHAILAALLLRPINTYKRKKVTQRHFSSENDNSNYLTSVTSTDKKVLKRHSIHGKSESNSLTALNLTESPAEHISVADLLKQVPSPSARITEISTAGPEELGSNSTEEVSIPLIQNDNEINNNTGHLATFSETKENKRKGNVTTDTVKLKTNIEMESDLNAPNEYNGVNKYQNEMANATAHNDNIKQDAFIENLIVTNIPFSTKEPSEEIYATTKVTNEDIVIEYDGLLTGNISELLFSDSREKGNMSSNDDVSQISGTVINTGSSKNRYYVETVAPKVPHASNWSLFTSSAMGSMLNIAHTIEPQVSPDVTKPKSRIWIKDLIDIKLLKNYLALMIAFNYIFIHMGSFSTVYLPSYAKGNGVSAQRAAILLTIVGSMDIVGRLAFGFLADLKVVRPHLIIAGISATLGVVTHFMPLFTSFETLVVFSVAQGLLGGVGMNLTTVLIADVMGIQHLGKMLSMSSMFNSISFFVQHPIQGALIEATGGFRATYHYIGTSLLLSTCLLLTEPLLSKLQMAKEKTRDVKGNSTAP